MTADDEAMLGRLETLAKAAKAGPWESDGSRSVVTSDGVGVVHASYEPRDPPPGHDNPLGDATTDYIAAASPDVVLDMIAGLRRKSALILEAKVILETMVQVVKELRSRG